MLRQKGEPLKEHRHHLIAKKILILIFGITIEIILLIVSVYIKKELHPSISRGKEQVFRINGSNIC